MIRKKILLKFLILVLAVPSAAQDIKVTFGLQLEPLIPSSLIRSSNVTAFDQGVEFSTDPMPGIAYGAHVAFWLDERISLETGINHLIRDYRITATDITDGFELPLQFTADNFEIPFTFNYHIRLGERFYMDQSLGVSLQFLPGEFQSRILVEDENDNRLYEMSHISVRNYWVMPAFRGGFGFEYRTDKWGSFYAGPVYRLFSTLYFTRILYTRGDVNVNNLDIRPTGDYFSVLFRYTFPF
jgi:hypothetical protein